jgi:hypothetical protein
MDNLAISGRPRSAIFAKVWWSFAKIARRDAHHFFEDA